MGNILSQLFSHVLSQLQGRKRILLLGPGKTTLLSKLKLGKLVLPTPTINSVETIEYKEMKFTVREIGGQFKLRPLWKHYYSGADAVLFVVDAADRHRVGEAAVELHNVIQCDQLRDTLLLVYASKQDLRGCMSASEVHKALNLKSVTRNSTFFVQPVSVLSGDGVFEGMDWLCEALKGKLDK